MKSRNKRIWDRALTFGLVLLLLGAVISLVYVIVNPGDGKPFTEFYLLGLDGKSADYPSELNLGEEGKVVVGITNHEREETTYRVEVIINGQKSGEIESIKLVDKQKWETMINFFPETSGENQRIGFVLYKDEDLIPYLELYLLVTVVE